MSASNQPPKADIGFSPEESISLIQSMITQARGTVADNSFYLLFWGWLVFLCCLAEFTLKVLLQYPNHSVVWWSMPVGGVVTAIYSFRQSRKLRVLSFVDQALDFLWVGIGIAFGLLVYINIASNAWTNAFTYYILLYAIGTFVTGRLLRFKPLMIGGLLNFILAGVCVHFSYDYQLLIACLALLISYIIPGHLLRNRYRQNR